MARTKKTDTTEPNIAERFTLCTFDDARGMVDAVEYTDYAEATEAGKTFLRSGASVGSYFVIDKTTVLVSA